MHWVAYSSCGRVSRSVQGPVQDPDPSGDLPLLSAALIVGRLTEEDEGFTMERRATTFIMPDHQRTCCVQCLTLAIA